MSARRFVLTSTALLVAAGCGNDLPQITEITDTRVVGAFAEVVGAPERATPRPGEEAVLRFAVVSPEGNVDPERLSSMFIDCTYPNAFTGIPLCQELIDLAKMADPNAPPPPPEDLEPVRCTRDQSLSLQGVQGTCVSGEPVVPMQIPSDYAAPRRLVRGVICDRGEPFADVTLPELFGCDLEPGGKAILVHGSVRVALSEADENLNPRLQDIRLSLNGRPWDAVDEADLPPEDDCRAAVDERGLLAIDPYEHMLGIEMDAADRELSDGVPEDLEFQLYASAGEVGRRFTVFEGSDPGVDGLLSDSIPWVAPPPRDVPPGGMLVRLYLSILDRRGGYALAVRHACVYAEDSL